MLIRTHLSITIFGILILISHIEDKFVFVVLALFFTFVPDIDTKMSSLGRKKIFRPLQFFVKHRGIFHSYTFLLAVTFILVLFLPVVALPFFLAYALHLFADSFTKDGIYPFYPWKSKSSWKIKSGGKIEISVFVTFIILDAVILLLKIF
ncbi:metal-dependent hydrolase [archaeon]|jgi:membrane-bound metal-dependent hydrolase YbcI (DUF457 family)|nr:metal-dependent hydrolase [archaeon]